MDNEAYEMWMDGEGLRGFKAYRQQWFDKMHNRLPNFLKPNTMEYKLILKTGKSENLSEVLWEFNTDIGNMVERGWTPFADHNISFDPYHHKVVISQMMFYPSHTHTNPIPSRVTFKDPI